MIIKDLDEIYGPILVFGGIYSNLHALQALIKVAEHHEIPSQNVICTGDVVAYCADAQDCAALVRKFGCHVLAGNCEKKLAENADDCGCGFEQGSACSLMARSWYMHAKSQLTQKSRDWMKTLPDRIIFKHHGKRYGVVHGGASDVSKFIWPNSTNSEINNEINILEDEVGSIDCILAGHTGIPMLTEIEHKTWLNSGAIGLPSNNGCTNTHYAIIDENRVEFKDLTYDYQGAKQAMQSAGLVQGYHDCLETGLWPSEDTLPIDLRRNQSASG